MNKNNTLVLIIAAVIILVVIAFVTLQGRKNDMRGLPQMPPLSQSDLELNKAITSDTTTDINSNLKNINLEDTSSTELKEVDQEIEKL